MKYQATISSKASRQVGRWEASRPVATRIVRQAFTLVELLAVITIIGVLSALVIGVYRGAQQDTLAAKTRTTISKIESVLDEKMNEYLSKPISYQANFALGPSLLRVQRMPVERNVGAFRVQRRMDTNWPSNVPPIGVLRERVRLAAVRDSMRMEMPDCVADVFAASFAKGLTLNALLNVNVQPAIRIDTGFQQIPSSGSPSNLVMQVDYPSSFRRIVEKIWAADALLPSPERWCDTYPNEELLYQIVENSIVGGSPAIEIFGESEIGDLDDDGLPEFIDAWDQPIRFIRWPSGVASVEPFNPDPLNTSSPVGTDPYDPTQADLGFDRANNSLTPPSIAYPGYFPKPLIVSAGLDGRFGIRFYPVAPASSGLQASPTATLSRSSVSGSSVPRAPQYWLTSGTYNYGFPDPFFPRAVGTLGPIESQIYRMGALLRSNIDTVRDPVGINMNSTPMTFIPHPNANDTNYALHRRDNVSNLDESGASL